MTVMDGGKPPTWLMLIMLFVVLGLSLMWK